MFTLQHGRRHFFRLSRSAHRTFKYAIRTMMDINDGTSLSKSRLNEVSDEVRYRKQRRGADLVTSKLQLPTENLTDIELKINNKMNRASNVKGIKDILKDHWDDIQHPSILGKAMKKCKQWNEHEAVVSIMKMSVDGLKQLDIVQFNIFFDAMALRDSPEISIEYLNIMRKHYNLVPNVITFGLLIRACKYQPQHRYELAEKYWNMMQEVGVEPDLITYNEMIIVCARSCNVDRARQITCNIFVSMHQKPHCLIVI